MMEISTTNIYDDRPIQRREKRRILVNLVVLSVSFMIHYSAVNGILQLQSTINASESLGTAALTSNFAGFLFSSVFGSTTLLHWLGCKWTVVACYLAFVPYFFSQIYPELSSMVLTALLLGLASGPLACAQGTYLSVLSELYSELTGLNSGVVTMQFFTVFYMLYNSSQIWGNLVSSLVFSLGDDQVQDNVECGATFCLGTASATNNTNLERPSDDKIYTVVGIYLGCIAVATCIVAFGLESLKSYNESCKDRKINRASPLELLTISLKMCRHPNIILLIPLTIWSGMEQSFFMADYTAAYVSCAWGIRYIGYVTVCFGVTDVLSASLTGPLGKALGRVSVMSFAAALQVASIVTLLCWKPSIHDKATLFVISGLWGVTDGILSVQSNALYGIFFPGQEEGAFNNFSFWYASGFVVNFAYSSYLCTDIKLYILLAVTLFGLLGYYAVEWLERNKERKSIYFVN